MLNLPFAVGSLEVTNSAHAAVRGGVYSNREEIGFDDVLRINAQLLWRKYSLGLVYAPRLGVGQVLDGTIPTQTTFMHEVGGTFGVRAGRFQLELREDFSIGEQSFGTLYGVPPGLSVAPPGAAAGGVADTPLTGTMAGLPPGAGDLILLASGVRVWSSRTAAMMQYMWSRRWDSTLDVSYTHSGVEQTQIQQPGGITEQLYYPQLRSADASASLMYDASAEHRIGTIFEGRRGWSQRDDFWIGSASLAWTARAGSRTTFDTRAGAAYRDNLALNRTRQRAIVPIGAFEVSHSIISLAGSYRLLANVTYEPLVNVLQAVLQDRLTGLASASFATERDRFTLSFSASQSIPASDPESATFVGGSISYDHRFAPWVGMEFGGQFADQITDNAVSTGTIWTLYVGLVTQLEPVRF